jgi:general secretion pathway protein A
LVIRHEKASPRTGTLPPLSGIYSIDDMYAEFFHLSEMPFSLTPDPRFLYASGRHREGLAHLFYGIQQHGGFVQLTGEVGCGKTMLCRSLVQQLPPETDIALILNPCLTALELLAAVCDELRVSYPDKVDSIKVLIDALNRHLLESHAQNRRTVLIIDEAQNLSGDVLEQIRLLTNLETTRDKLLQIILIGQPELLSVLRRKELRQLAQRITARYHLLPLTRSETCAYIRHRLSVAGRKTPLFTPGALRRVYLLSGGVPRRINIICDRALLGAYSMDKRQVTAAIVKQAGRETGGTLPWFRRPHWMWLSGAAAVAILISGMAAARMIYRPVPGDLKPLVSATPSAAPAGKSAAKTAAAGNPELNPASTSAPAAAVRPKLESVLSDPSLPEGSGAGYKDLFARWGVQLPGDRIIDECWTGREFDFACQSQPGGWPKLRRLNLPAILELVLPSGKKQRAVLVFLDDNSATLVVSGRQYEFSLLEIDRFWDGSFTVIWKPPFNRKELLPGLQGEEVVWVRRALDTIERKEPAGTVIDRFDEALRQRVAEFQGSRSLIPDGLVGSETLIRLTAELEGREAPSISTVRNRQGRTDHVLYP